MDWANDPEFKKLRLEFQDLLIERRNELIQSLEALKKQPQHSAEFKKICNHIKDRVHRLAGSAGSYGFMDLGHSAEAFDAWIESHPLKLLPKQKWIELCTDLLRYLKP